MSHKNKVEQIFLLIYLNESKQIFLTFTQRVELRIVLHSNNAKIVNFVSKQTKNSELPFNIEHMEG